MIMFRKTSNLSKSGLARPGTQGSGTRPATAASEGGAPDIRQRYQGIRGKISIYLSICPKIIVTF